MVHSSESVRQPGHLVNRWGTTEAFQGMRSQQAWLCYPPVMTFVKGNQFAWDATSKDQRSGKVAKRRWCGKNVCVRLSVYMWRMSTETHRHIQHVLHGDQHVRWKPALGLPMVHNLDNRFLRTIKGSSSAAGPAWQTPQQEICAGKKLTLLSLAASAMKPNVVSILRANRIANGSLSSCQTPAHHISDMH